MKLKVALVLAGVGFLMSGAAANAVLIDHGVTYDLQLTSGSLNSTSANFNLHISGINGAADTEQGRYGVNDFAFSLPANFSSATALGFVTQNSSGLNAGGCSGAGAFFCFNGTAPSGPALAVNSIIDIPFAVTLSSGNFIGWDAHLKIDWQGTKNNYDLVSKSINGISTIQASPVPGPIVGAGLPGLAFAGAGLIAWLRRRRAKAA